MAERKLFCQIIPPNLWHETGGRSLRSDSSGMFLAGRVAVMRKEPTNIQGASVVENSIFLDKRGSFSKVFSSSYFSSTDQAHGVAEIFWSASGRDVVRGMHYQGGSGAQSKLVTVVAGEILDVLLDLRVNSPSFGTIYSEVLSCESGRSLFIPPGVAHGFKVLSGSAVTLYSVSTEHCASLDLGVRYDSFGFSWPGGLPIVSERDLSLPIFSPTGPSL